MNIEISDEKYWKRCNYHDGLLYCQLLVIAGKTDWRMFNTKVEYHDYILSDNAVKIIKMQELMKWFLEDGHKYEFSNDNKREYWVIPIRDI